jgi:hypothetical protein
MGFGIALLLHTHGDQPAQRDQASQSQAIKALANKTGYRLTELIKYGSSAPADARVADPVQDLFMHPQHPLPLTVRGIEPRMAD